MTLKDIYQKWLNHGFNSIVRDDIEVCDCQYIDKNTWEDITGILNINGHEITFKNH